MLRAASVQTEGWASWLQCSTKWVIAGSSWAPLLKLPSDRLLAKSRRISVPPD